MGSPLLMGVLNVTPDSFSDGGRFVDEGLAVDRALAMIAEGADVIDVGAESTRPGASHVPATEQLRRIGSVIRRVVASGGVCSIDTTLPDVARRALDDGATWVNSVSLEPAAELGELAHRFGAKLVLMHSRGSMTHMPGFSAYADDAYGDVVADVAREWSEHAARALDAGIPRESLFLDPGFGFQKNARQSLELCARLDELVALGFPVLAGPSRKSFVARATSALGESLPEAHERLGGTVSAVLACARRGARAVRVHDVFTIRQALRFELALGSARDGSLGPRGGAS